MANNNRNRLNQPPTAEGKKQSPHPGEPNKLNKRAEVLQSSYAQQNIGATQDEEAARTGEPEQRSHAKKMKAGR